MTSMTTTTKNAPRHATPLETNPQLGWDRGGLRVGGTALLVGGLITGIFNALHPLPGDTVQSALRGIVDAGVLFWKFDHLMLMVGFWLLAWGFIQIHHAVGNGPGATASRLGFFGILMGTAAWTIHDALDGFARAEIAADWAVSTGATEATLLQIATAMQHITDATFPLTASFYWASLAIFGIGIVQSRVLPQALGVTLTVIGGMVTALAVYALFNGFGGTWDVLFAAFATLTVVWAMAAGIWLLRRARTSGGA